MYSLCHSHGYTPTVGEFELGSSSSVGRLRRYKKRNGVIDMGGYLYQANIVYRSLEYIFWKTFFNMPRCILWYYIVFLFVQIVGLRSAMP